MNLKKGFEIQHAIDNLNWKYKNLKFSSNKSNVTSSSFQNSTEYRLLKLAEIQKQIDNLQFELAKVIRNLENFIENSTLDDKSKVILIRRYCYLETFDQISKCLGFTQRHIYRLHRNALKVVSTMSVSSQLDIHKKM